MKNLIKVLTPMMLVCFTLTFAGVGLSVDDVEAKSRRGGKSFRMKPTYKKSPAKTTSSAARQNHQGGGFGRGLMGGLLGGALGGLLFGSMFGAGGSGMGILPILLLAGGAYFLFKRFSAGRRGQSTAGGFPGGGPSQQGFQREGQQTVTPDVFGGGNHSQDAFSDSSTPEIGGNLLEEGLEQIRQYDRDFDPKHFTEVASDVFFQVQAGWMRRDLDSYRHLLGEQLAGEYADHFEEMKAKGIINKLESIAIRGVDIVQAGSDGSEDFVTIKFTASLLDYNVDDKTGELVDGSMTTPVKFEEEWSWARPTGTQDWKLEGIH